MGKPNPQHDVYVCKDVAVQIGEWWAPVSSINIVLTATTLPSCVVSLDPAHTGGSVFVDTPTDVSTATATSLSVLKDWSDRVQAAVGRDDIKARVLVTIENVDPAPGSQPKQHLDLQGWRVVAAGITDANTSGQFALEVELQHPAGALTCCPATIGNVGKDTSAVWDSDTYENPLQGLQAAILTWAGLDRVAPTQVTAPCIDGVPNAKNMQDAMDSAVAALQLQAEQMMTFLEWKTTWPGNTPNYSDMPLASTCWDESQAPSPLCNGARLALTLYASAPESISIWDIIASTMCDEWQLAIIPTYWKSTLQLMPFSPWARPSIIVYDDEISGLRFPGADPALLGGVKIAFSVDQAPLTDDSYFVDPTQIGQQQAVEVLYMPELASPIGRIATEAVPSWLPMAAKGDAAALGARTEPGAHEDSALTTPENIGKDMTPNVTAGADLLDPCGEYIGGVYRFAAQKFLSLYRVHVEAGLNPTCLMITTQGSKWEGNYVIPGCVLRVQSRDGDKVLFDMYLTEVRHCLSAANGQAYTQLRGSYCRVANGIESVITSPTYNPLYA